jgi:hypothetical protein
MKVRRILSPVVTGFIGLSLNAAPLPSSSESDAFDAASVLRFTPPVVVKVDAFDMSRIIGTQTQFIRHEATAYQRKVAEANARAYMTAQRRTTAEPKPAGTPRSKAKKTKPPEPPTAIAPKKKLPRYIAVDTVKDERSSPKAKKVVMIWDTQSESIVGNNIYDLESPPSVGSTAKIETFSAEYVGAGF